MLNALKTEPRTLDEPQVAVFFASQTGTGEGIAETLGLAASQIGLQVKLQSVNQLRPAAIRKVEYAVFIISTHGEGDPPDDALDLFEYLQSERVPQLKQLKFSVLALGDSSYEKFCEAGRKLEELLVARGATAFAERVECDLEFQEPSDRWNERVIEFGRKNLMAGDGVGSGQSAPSAAHLSLVPTVATWNRTRPFPSIVERVQKITGLESGKDVYHVELSLAGSGLKYQPGDSLGIRTYNDPELVQSLLIALALDPAMLVEHEGRVRSLREWLTRYREITRLSTETLHAWAKWAGDKALSGRLAGVDAPGLKAFMEQRQLIDLADEYPASPRAEELLATLRPLATRSYSIASSQAFVDEEVHLTVATLFSDAIGRQRRGVASNFLNHRVQPGDELGVFLEPNRRFRLPEDRSRPLIMISAGTGIAPYRAFLQQLEEEASNPQSWLIFGNPHLRSDFLYQREWLHWRKTGLLDRIDVAFSRDQVEKRYVQHRVQEQAGVISEWLDRGAQVYVCGGLDMGHAVEHALLQGVAEHRGLDEQQTTEFVSGLRRERTILKDLY